MVPASHRRDVGKEYTEQELPLTAAVARATQLSPCITKFWTLADVDVQTAWSPCLPRLRDYHPRDVRHGHVLLGVDHGQPDHSILQLHAVPFDHLHNGGDC